MSYAIVEVGGQQIRVEPGRFYDLNYLGVDPDSSYSIDKVLCAVHRVACSVNICWFYVLPPLIPTPILFKSQEYLCAHEFITGAHTL